jgi:hypothetical protein
MHVQAGIVLGNNDRRTRPNAHPDPQRQPIGPWLGSKCPLRGHSRCHRVAGLGEGDEEPVAFGADLMAVVLTERRPKELLVHGQDLDLPVP